MLLLNNWVPRILTDSAGNGQPGNDGTGADASQQVYNPLVDMPMQVVMPKALTDTTQVNMPNVTPSPPWQTISPDPFGLRPFYTDDKHPHYRPGPGFSPTPDEAQQIADLKAQGRNAWRPFIPPALSLSDQNGIINYSRAMGIDPKLMLPIDAIESGGNRNAISRSGPIGEYQIAGDTADGLGVKNRFDADQNIRGGIILARQNTDKLNSLNLPTTNENIYIMHQLGEPMALKVIRAAQGGKSVSELDPKIQDAIEQNNGNRDGTAQEYLNLWKDKLDKEFNDYFKNIPDL